MMARRGVFPTGFFYALSLAASPPDPLPNTAHTMPPCAPSNDAMMVMTSAFPHWGFYAPSLASSPWVLMTCGLLTGAHVLWLFSVGTRRGGGSRAAERTPDYANQCRVRLIVPKKDLI